MAQQTRVQAKRSLYLWPVSPYIVCERAEGTYNTLVTSLAARTTAVCARYYWRRHRASQAKPSQAKPYSAVLSRAEPRCMYSSYYGVTATGERYCSRPFASAYNIILHVYKCTACCVPSVTIYARRWWPDSLLKIACAQSMRDRDTAPQPHIGRERERRKITNISRR